MSNLAPASRRTEQKKKSILFICGSENQTSQMHAVAKHLGEYEQWFTPFYGGKLVEFFGRHDILVSRSIAGKRWRSRCMAYLEKHELPIDFRNQRKDYDLVVTCQDICTPPDIGDYKVVLVQEGMMDPKNFFYYLVKTFRFLPLWLASTSTTGLTDCYVRFCVASDGYKALFESRGVRSEKMIVTGIPNFDDLKKHARCDFPMKGYVLVVTSDGRETGKFFDSRKKLVENAVRIANGRPVVFKLHPNEFDSRVDEIKRWAPDAIIVREGKAEDLVGNCDVLVTEYSTCTFVGLALGKEVHSYFDLGELRKLMPVQNASAAKLIADVCRDVIEGRIEAPERTPVRAGTRLLGEAQPTP